MRAVIGAEPAPDSFLRAAEMLWVNPQRSVVEDTISGIYKPVLKVDLGWWSALTEVITHVVRTGHTPGGH